MAHIILQRSVSNDECTFGTLSVFGETVWTLEDPRRRHKVHGETRIPAGRYELRLRNEGGMTQRYAARFPDIHKGMIWLQDVPYFEWVYIHIGNTARDTEGCILVGMDSEAEDNMILGSAAAYRKIYPLIVEAIQNDGCSLVIRDEE